MLGFELATNEDEGESLKFHDERVIEPNGKLICFPQEAGHKA